MMRMLIWAMLRALVWAVPVDWDEQPEWREWRQLRCDQAYLESQRAAVKIRERDRMPSTDQRHAERLNQQRALVDSMNRTLRCLQM